MVESYRDYKNDEAKAKVYNHRVTQAEAEQKDWQDNAERWVRRYENVISRVTPDAHEVNVPVGISIIDALYSSLTATDVDVLVRPIGTGTDNQAYVATAALSKEWDLCKVPRRANKAVKDALLTSIGWVKVGYDYYEELEEVPRPREDIVKEIDEMVSEAAGVEGGPEFEDIVGGIEVTEMKAKTIRDRIVVDYVPWKSILWDPTANQYEDCRWVAQVTKLAPEEVKANPLWREYCKRTRGGLRRLDELKADTTIDFNIVQPGEKADREDERVTVIELYDFETGNVCTFAKGADWLLNEVPNVFSLNPDLEDRSPFVPLILRGSPNRVRGISELEVLEPTLKALDLYNTRLATHLERSSPKVIVPARAMTPAGKEAMKSQEYGAVVELEESFSPNDIKPFEAPQLASEVYGMADKLENAAREATGVNELMRGLFPDRKRTATETSEVVSASAARQSEKRIQLENFYREVAQRMLQLMQVFYTKDRVVQFVDIPGDFQFTWTANDIAMESKLEIELTPKEAKTWQSRRDNATTALNVLGPFATPGPNGDAPVRIEGLLNYIGEELGIPRRSLNEIITLPAQKQQMQLEQQQAMAGQASAEAGLPRADMVPGPVDAQALAAATNQGEIPPEILMAAQGAGPMGPQAAEQVSESAGQAGPVPGM